MADSNGNIPIVKRDRQDTSLFGRPDHQTAGDLGEVYGRKPLNMPWPGNYGWDNDERRRERPESHIPARQKTDARSLPNHAYNSLNIQVDAGPFDVENFRAVYTITPNAGTDTAQNGVTVNLSAVEDVALDAARKPAFSPGAGIYIAVRRFSAVGGVGATGAINWTLQVYGNRWVTLGTTLAAPSSTLITVETIAPNGVEPDRLQPGQAFGVLRATAVGVATPASISGQLSFSVLYSLPPEG